MQAGSCSRASLLLYSSSHCLHFLHAGWELQSGKFAVLAGMLELLRTCTRDRIVVVSNYTQTLDLVSQVTRASWVAPALFGLD